MAPIAPCEEARIAYFSMEIALEPGILTYSGGLGMLAGDTLRSAADFGFGVVGVTLGLSERVSSVSVWMNEASNMSTRTTIAEDLDQIANQFEAEFAHEFETAPSRFPGRARRCNVQTIVKVLGSSVPLPQLPDLRQRLAHLRRSRRRHFE